VLITAVVLVALAQTPDPASAAPAAPKPPSAAAPARRQGPPPTLEEMAIANAIARTSAKVAEVREALKAPGVTPRQRTKLKKDRLHAEARAREARQAAINYELRKEQDAYVAKMMPIWLEQQRQNAQMSIEMVKAQALQQMAITAEKRRQDDLWIQWQRNQILGR
jgi:hypothetical protein